MLKCVLFDLDGTLLDTLQDLTTACNHAMTAVGCPTLTLDDVRTRVGDGVAMLISRALPSDKQGRQEEAIAAFKGFYSQHSADCSRPYDGVLQLLDALAVRGVRVGVVSNKPQYAVDVLVPKFFPSVSVYVGNTSERKPKPAADAAEYAIHALGVSKRETVYVGDSDTDLLTAQNTDVPCISAAWGFRGTAFLSAHGATAIASTPKDVLRLLGEEYAL